MLTNASRFGVFKLYLSSTLGIIMLLSGVQLYAQQYDSIAYDLKWVNLPDLSANRDIREVCQDRSGILWIASKVGLYRYDGATVERHDLFNKDTLFNEGVKSVNEDEEGNLWVGTEHGLRILDPKRSTLLRLNEFQLPDSFSHKPICLTEGPGTSLFIMTGKQIFQYQSRQIRLKWVLPGTGNFDPVSIQYSRRDAHLYCIVVDTIYEHFVVVEPTGKVIIDPALYNDDSQLIVPLIFTGYLNTKVKAGSVVFHHNYRALYYDKQLQSFILKPNNEELRYWTDLFQLIRSFIQKKVIFEQGEPTGFVISRVYELSNGLNILLTSEGFAVLQPKKIYFRQIKASLGKRIRAIQTDGFGRLIYSTYPDLLWQYPNDNRTHLVKKDWLTWVLVPTDKNRTRFFMGQSDVPNTWIYTNSSVKSVSVLRKKSTIPFFFDYTGTFSLCAENDTFRGGIWHSLHCGSFFQIIFYDVQKGRHYFLNRISHFKEPRNIIAGKDLWMGGPSGLRRFLHPNPRLGLLTENNAVIPVAIKNLSILCLYAGAGNVLWFGVDSKGLCRYTPETGQYELFTTKEGLAENSVFSIIGEPGDSVLWLGTGKGLSRFDVKRRQFENFYRKDGLAGDEFNTAAVHRAPDGTIYMGGQNGIVSFHPKDFSATSVVLRQSALFSLFSAKNDAATLKSILSSGDVIRVRPDIQLIQVTFHTEDYLHAEQQRFRYRILGVINTWQYLSYNEKALFPYLPAGKHKLEVQVQTYRGLWLPPVYYTLNVLPPWYATWWFRSLLVLGISAMLYGLYLLRIRQLRQEFELRQQISHDLHDSLGSRIFLLRRLSQQIANPLLPDKDKQTNLDKFETISQDTFKAIRDFIWAFDPKQDQVAQLFERMDNFAENYLSPLIDELSIDHKPVAEHYKIGPRTKHHLMNVYQELLTNMIKHTLCQSIHIQLKVVDKQLFISIHNRHEGYQKNQTAPIHSGAESYGIENMQLQLQGIKAQLEWSEPNANEQMVSLSVWL